MFFGHPSGHATSPREKCRYFGFYRQIGAPVNMSSLVLRYAGGRKLLGIIGGDEAAG
jgi:hypothetical protein